MRAQPSSSALLLSRLLRALSSLLSACSQWLLLLSRGVWRSCTRAVWMLNLRRCCKRDTESTCPTLRTTRSTRPLSDRSTGDIRRTWCSLSTESMRWTNDFSPGQRWVWHRSTRDSDSCSLGKVMVASAFAKLFALYLIGQNWVWTKCWNYSLCFSLATGWLCNHCKLHGCTSVLCIVMILLSLRPLVFGIVIPQNSNALIWNYFQLRVEKSAF